MIVVIYQHESATGIYVSPISWTPSFFPSYLIPLGCPQVLSLGTLLHSLNLHWSSILHMVMYMLECYSAKSSHPFLLPLVQKSVLYIWISLAVLHTESSVQFTHSVVSDSLWPHELQHTRPPCPSPTPRVHSYSHPSMVPFSHLILCRPLFLLPPNPSQHPSLFQWVSSSHEVAKVLEFQL